MFGQLFLMCDMFLVLVFGSSIWFRHLFVLDIVTNPLRSVLQNHISGFLVFLEEVSGNGFWFSTFVSFQNGQGMAAARL